MAQSKGFCIVCFQTIPAEVTLNTKESRYPAEVCPRCKQKVPRSEPTLIQLNEEERRYFYARILYMADPDIDSCVIERIRSIYPDIHGVGGISSLSSVPLEREVRYGKMLLRAAELVDIEIVDWVLQICPEAATRTDKYGIGVLSYAAATANFPLEVFTRLLDMGVDPDLTCRGKSARDILLDVNRIVFLAVLPPKKESPPPLSDLE